MFENFTTFSHVCSLSQSRMGMRQNDERTKCYEGHRMAVGQLKSRKKSQSFDGWRTRIILTRNGTQ